MNTNKVGPDIGNKLVCRLRNFNKNIENIDNLMKTNNFVGKPTNTIQPDTNRKDLFHIDSEFVISLDKTVLKNGEVWRMDFWDYSDADADYCVDLSREKLKGLAEFILKYLEKN